MRDLFENDSMALARTAARVVLRSIVCRITGRVAAAATALSESHISKALGDTPDDRNLLDRHVDAILALATPAEVTAYWNARMKAYGLVAKVIAPRTVEERLARLEFKVATKFGALGVEVIENERNQP